MSSRRLIACLLARLLDCFGPYYVILGSTSQLVNTSHLAVVVIYPEYFIFLADSVLSGNVFKTVEYICRVFCLGQ